MKFTSFGFHEKLIEALDYMRFEEATPIQEKAIPEILNGHDIIACAQTGTGKTAAFILPILNKLVDKTDNSINTVVIVPTRELAKQIEQEIQGFSYFISVGSIAIYGGGDGKNWDDQKNTLSEGTDILVVTPGKFISHLKMGYIQLDKVEHLILDEADRMMDMGFADDLHTIISHLPEKRQTLLFSATMPPKIRTLSQKILKNPIEITLSISKPAAGIKQFVYLAFDTQKSELVNHIIKEKPEYNSIIIFTSSKNKVSEIVRTLRKNGHRETQGISSNLEQDQREEVLNDYRSKKTRILVATDVMSRGIDIKEINMVINYDVPGDAEDYVHRIGRTARANTTGEAYTLVNPIDMKKMKRIEELIEMEVPRLELPSVLGEAPVWDTKTNFGNPKKKWKKKPFKPKS